MPRPIPPERFRPGGLEDSIAFPKAKPRQLFEGLMYRLYYLGRPVLPARALRRWLLRMAWISRQLAWEEAWRSLPPAAAQGLTRPHVDRLIRDNVRRGATVVDLGGGSGFASRMAAEIASRVLYVDRSQSAANEARQRCKDVGNVEFVIGESLAVLDERGPFDVALLLHGLGYYEDSVATLARIAKRAARVLIEVPDFASDPLNRLRLAEGLPCYTDREYRFEFGPEDLERCIRDTGLTVASLESCNGCVLAVADVPGARS